MAEIITKHFVKLDKDEFLNGKEIRIGLTPLAAKDKDSDAVIRDIKGDGWNSKYYYELPINIHPVEINSVEVNYSTEE